MNVMLYPYHALPPYDPTGRDAHRLAKLASVFLFFDSVTLGRIGYPDELQLASGDEALSEMHRIEEVRGKDSVRAFFEKGERGNFSCAELAMLAFVRYWYDEQKFRISYGPLFDEGVLRIASLAEITHNAKVNAESGGIDGPHLSMDAPLYGFMSTYDEFAGWPNDEAEDSVFSQAFVDADGSGLTSLYLCKILTGTSDGTLQERSDRERLRFFREAFLLDVYHQTLLSGVLSMPIVSLMDEHIYLRTRYLSRMRGLRNTAPPNDPVRTALEIFGETLRQIPSLVPKSPESILEIREEMEDELAEFREAITHCAQDLIHELSSGISHDDIEYLVNKEFKRPLAKLDRRLAHPSKELLRNLVSGPSVLSGIGLALAFVDRSPDVIVALLGVSTAVLTASLRTHFDRKKAVEESGLAFLIRAA